MINKQNKQLTILYTVLKKIIKNYNYLNNKYIIKINSIT